MTVDLLRRRLEYLSEYISQLRQVGAVPLTEYLGDPIRQRAAERLLQVSLECAADAGAAILKAGGRPIPPDYRTLFKQLREADVIPCSLADSLASLATARNRIVHEYARVSAEESYALIHTALDAHMGFFELATRLAESS